MITRTKALKLLRKAFPNGATIREDKQAPTPAERPGLVAQLKAHREATPKPLPYTPEQLQRYAEIKAHRDREHEMERQLYRYRWNATCSTGGWIARGAIGDTLEALLDNAGVKLPPQEDTDG